VNVFNEGAALAGAEAGPAPTELVAVTVQEYDVPFARPPMRRLGPGPVTTIAPGLHVAV
jgi:hypothetical protein